MCMYHFYNNNLKMERRGRRRCWCGVTQQLQAAGWPPCVRGDHRSLPWELRTYCTSYQLRTPSLKTSGGQTDHLSSFCRPCRFPLELRHPLRITPRVGGVGGLTPSLGCCRDQDQGLPPADLFLKNHLCSFNLLFHQRCQRKLSFGKTLSGEAKSEKKVTGLV